MSNKTPTLSHFLLQTDTQIRFFDLGRRVSKIALSDFQKIEQAEVPYPYPYEQTAWIGLLFWNKKDKTQHNIWFLRMPLDETGYIQLSARDEFMHMLLSRFNEQIQNPGETQSLAHILKDNPYVFKPTDDKLAVFHAKALLTLKQTPSQFFSDAVSYLASNHYEQWEKLGIQGIADTAVRHDQKDIQQTLIKALPKLPMQVFNAFSQSLENEDIDIELAKAVATRLAKTNDDQLISSGIRALANCQSSQFKHDVIFTALENSKPDQTMILVAIAAKTWEVLEDEKMLNLFLEKLASNNNGAKLFNSLLIDLMFLPKLREKILTEFRRSDRSENLSNAVGQFFQTMRA